MERLDFRTDETAILDDPNASLAQRAMVQLHYDRLHRKDLDKWVFNSPFREHTELEPMQMADVPCTKKWAH